MSEWVNCWKRAAYVTKNINVFGDLTLFPYLMALHDQFPIELFFRFNFFASKNIAFFMNSKHHEVNCVKSEK